MKNYGIGFFNAFILAMAVYAGLIFFIFYNRESSKMVSYTDIKDSISVEITEYKKPEAEVKPEKKAKPKPKPKKEATAVGQETTNKMVKTEAEAKKDTVVSKDLFGDIKEFQTEKTTKVQSSEQSVPDAAKPETKETVAQRGDSLMPAKEKVGETSGKKQKGLYNKFLGAVERKLHENWNLYERSGNFVAEIKYQIESNGFFRYTAVSKSGNDEFDTKVLDFLSTLEGKYVAVPPNKKVYKGSARLSDEITMMGD